MNLQTQFNDLVFNPITIILFIVFTKFIIFLYKYKQYRKSTYYHITNNSYLSVCFNKGLLGEYLLYKRLRSFENTGGKFLFNLYIPSGNKTTEIDLLLIHSKGVFVLESKNYAGWIFGNETQRNWTQVIYDSKKYFYNPIMQNNLHINCLKKIIGESIPMHSIIAFSDKCTLKNITIKNSNVNVANQREVVSVINQICEQINAVLLSETDVFNIYGKLYPYTQISREVKINHIANIQTS